MPSFSYLVLDVFTAKPLAGNPLAVLTDARGLDAGQMQAITREFNFSETVFILPPEDPCNAARLRIFAPHFEMPFAGHPVIGAAIALHAQPEVFGKTLTSDFAVETGIGPLPCCVTQSEGLRSARFENTAPLTRYADPTPDLIAACLSLPESALVSAPVMVSKGVPYVIAELASAEILVSCAPNWSAFTAAEAAFPSGEGPLAIYAVLRRDAGTIEARMFDPLGGIVEDPATGSAAAALAAYLCDAEGGPQNITIHQGEAMGRPSTIHATAKTDSAGQSAVTIAGTAVEVMRGTLSL